MISLLLSRLVLLVCGTLYPAYASYKTVKTKNVREYVRWMSYWIVFAIYTLVEIFADVFLSFWFPFYYELKIFFVLWLVCPATKGSTYIFRKVINPRLSQHEVMIDSYIASLWDHGYDIARMVGTRGVDYMIEILLDLIRKGQLSLSHYLPQATEIALQHASAIQQSSASGYQTDRIDLSDEDFDEFLDQVRQGKLSASQLRPPVPETVLKKASPQSKSPAVRQPLEQTINDEEFVIMTDQSEVDEPSTGDHLKSTELDTDPELCQVQQAKTRSKRVLRERKKTTKK